MGRKKIQIRRIECEKDRSSKYSKRKKGLLKKAYEIAKLCDVDIAMILFSSTNKATLYHSPCSPLSKILERLSLISLKGREERRAYTIKTLKKAYTDNTESPIGNCDPFSERVELFEENNKVNELKNARELLLERMTVLRFWQNPLYNNESKQLSIMETVLVSYLSQIMEIKLQEDQQTFT